LYQNTVSGVEDGTVIITNGTSAVQITMDNFFNESVRINNMSFWNKGAQGLNAAIIFEKDSASYIRGHEFNKLGFYNFDTCIVFRGLDLVDINNNFFGPTKINENFAYECGAGVYFENSYVNLFEISNSLYHSCTKYGIQIASNSGGVIKLSSTHFEACEPAAILAGGLVTVLNLDSVSAESTGIVSGNGILKTSSSINALNINVTDSGYNQSGFALMPDEYRLNRGAIINAASPVKASGFGWITNTPELVTPVVSNNATYNQSDVRTFGMCPLSSNLARSGNRVFDKFGGWNSAANLNAVPPNSVNLPESVRANFVGVNSGVDIISNISDTFTAPSNGYLYASWMGNLPGTDVGFASGSQVLINGNNTIPIGFTVSPYVGNFVLLVPMDSGDVLSRLSLALFQAPIWCTGVYTSFETTLLNMNDAACGYSKTTTTKYSVADSATLSLVDYNDGATPFSINVKLLFNGGALGYKEYLISSNGTLAASRVYTSIASSVVAGIAVTTNAGGNAQLYNIDVANTSGGAVTVTKQVTYIS
jgi:hypothetical protein